jgi:malate dehydrogenase (oxaloacetate-decarboxylating)
MRQRVIPILAPMTKPRGTNRESLLGDPTYVGNRHARVRGKRYEAFIEAYVKIATKLFPNALLQWEDFAPGNGRRILEKYRGKICTFNEDMQATGVIALAAAISAVRVCGTPLRNHRVTMWQPEYRRIQAS